MTQYSLTGTEQQMQLIAKALDLYMRIGMGQFESILDHPEVMKRVMESEHIYPSDGPKIFASAKVDLFNLEMNASKGVFNDELDKTVLQARDIFKAIEYRLSWDKAGNPSTRDLSTMGGCNFDQPRVESDLPAPIVNRAMHNKCDKQPDLQIS